MKIGTHAGETLPNILARKAREGRQAGFCLWGYGGSSCHPIRQVQALAELGPVSAMFLPTTSDPGVPSVPAAEWSADGLTWQALHPSHKVTGSRWALAIAELQPAEATIDLAAYSVAVGPSRGRALTDYLRGRTDKACAELSEDGALSPSPSRIVALGVLVAPYAVILR